VESQPLKSELAPGGSSRETLLGDVLYAGKSSPRVSEEDWARLVRAIAAGDQLALHALYERAHRPVFTLSVRITGNRETAEEVTLDVFHDVWRKASGYDPANGTVLGWIMNQARSRALDRLRFDKRKKRAAADGQHEAEAAEPGDWRDLLEFKQEAEALRRALVLLSPAERQAIEATFFSELTHAEAAQQLQQPLGTIKTRVRSALHKMRQALSGNGTGK
jgi:RNA polymerase sigma-70 factor, ECF subfamily